MAKNAGATREEVKTTMRSCDTKLLTGSGPIIRENNSPIAVIVVSEDGVLNIGIYADASVS